MKKSTTRAQMRHDILVNLGHPYITVNLSDEQLDKAINNALKIFFRNNYHGTFESCYVVQLTDQDCINGYVTVPEWIDSVVEVLPHGFALDDLNFMTVEYQMTRDIMMGYNNFSNINLVDFVTMKERLYNTAMIIEQPRGFVYVKYQRRMIPKFRMTTGHHIVMRCYENVDPENDQNNPDHVEAGEVFNDEYLKELATAFAQQIWGNILKKFGGVVLPGGVTLNGEKLYDDATAEIEKLSNMMLYGNPVDFFMG